MSEIVPSKRRWEIKLTALRSDADAVTAQLEDLKDNAALAEWKAKREGELKARRQVRF